MTCTNCSLYMGYAKNYCGNCGAKVVTERITVKKLFSDFATNVFGWDNKFFFTIRMLIQKPQVLFKEYIGGTRKKYMNPFTMLALGAAVALFVFNFFAEDYLALNIESNRQSVEMMAGIMEKQLGENFDAISYKEETMELITELSSFMLKYFNLLVIVFLPFYTFLAFLTYRKPYNYGEHLVINSYIQGFSFLTTSIIFTICVFTDPSVYLISIVLLVIYYTYAYGKLHGLKVVESILKLFKFFGILAISGVIMMMMSFLVGLAVAAITH